ncbi:hypothetical protein ACFOSV_15605 [Algoriphagus namhaensis]|uniref:DUF4369 domain-containing protein n=1 Tax=Algoriphagus namhaensis TaxID=915353 RepID=A0ABV8AVJ5_9BACT
MKKLLVTSLLCLVFGLAWAQNYVNGYVLFAEQDTVKCQIKIGGKKADTNYYALVIKNQKGEAEDEVYKAKEGKVIGYGIREFGAELDYRNVEISGTNDGGFFKLVDNGPNYKLYLHMVSTSTNGVVTTLPQYAMYKPNGEYVILTTHMLGNWKKNLRKILADNPKYLPEVEKVGRMEIPEFVEKLNSEG